jgi:hypothetical protein
VLACVLDECAPIVAGIKGAPRDTAPLDLEMLVLPLRHHGKTHVRILGSLAPSHVPSWLGLLPVEPLTLTSFRKVEAPFKAGLHSVPPVPHAIARPPARHGRFTVYQGGR